MVVVFALLDAYCLTVERAYRDLYRTVAGGHEATPWILDAARVRPRDVLRQLTRFAIWMLHGVALAGAIVVALSE